MSHADATYVWVLLPDYTAVAPGWGKATAAYASIATCVRVLFTRLHGGGPLAWEVRTKLYGGGRVF